MDSSANNENVVLIYVFPNLYEFVSSLEHLRYFIECENQTKLLIVANDFQYFYTFNFLIIHIL